MSNYLKVSRPDEVPRRRHGTYRRRTYSDGKTRGAEHRPNVQNGILLATCTRTELQNVIRPVGARQDSGCDGARIQEVVGGIEIFLGREGDGSVDSAVGWIALVVVAYGRRRKVEGEGTGRCRESLLGEPEEDWGGWGFEERFLTRWESGMPRHRPS